MRGIFLELGGKWYFYVFLIDFEKGTKSYFKPDILSVAKLIISCNGQEMIFFLKGNLMRRASPTTLAYWMYLLMGEGGDIKVIHKIQFSKYLFLLHEHLCQMCFWWWKITLHVETSRRNRVNTVWYFSSDSC